MSLWSFLRFTQGILETMPDQIPIKRFRLGQMQSYEVLVSDFERIASEATSIGTDLAFTFACVPVAITIHITLKFVTVPDQSVKDPFILLMYACYILGAYFGVRAFRQRGNLKKFMGMIKNAQVPPLGEKGSELGPEEVIDSIYVGDQEVTQDTKAEGKK
jgi:hypothetical protein